MTFVGFVPKKAQHFEWTASLQQYCASLYCFINSTLNNCSILQYNIANSNPVRPGFWPHYDFLTLWELESDTE